MAAGTPFLPSPQPLAGRLERFDLFHRLRHGHAAGRSSAQARAQGAAHACARGDRGRADCEILGTADCPADTERRGSSCDSVSERSPDWRTLRSLSCDYRATVPPPLLPARRRGPLQVCFMPLRAFVAAGRLLSHEEARDRHLLHPILDTHADCVTFVRAHPTLFFSHQWTGFGHPDPSGEQYALMVRAAYELCATEDILPDELFVWVDFTSVPQANMYMQSLSIATLGVCTCERGRKRRRGRARAWRAGPACACGSDYCGGGEAHYV